MSMRRRQQSLPISLATLTLVNIAISGAANANVFGQCARQIDQQKKIAACVEASRSTIYPWILRWVYRELARAYQERSESHGAVVTYSRSHADEKREWARRQMTERSQFTPAAEPHSIAPNPTAGELCTGCFAYLEFSSLLEPESYATRGDMAPSPPSPDKGNGRASADWVANSKK